MNKCLKQILLAVLLSNFYYSQIGIGNSNPKGILDLNRDDGKSQLGLVLPREELSSLSNIYKGTLIYDLNDECLRIRNASSWSDCTHKSKELIINGNCFYFKNIYYCLESVDGIFWLDRNIGALGIDGQNSGYFQYGRSGDGHQNMISSTINYESLSNKPIDFYDNNPEYEGKFIINMSHPNWMFPDVEMKNAWAYTRSHLSNNPCPMGYSVPTSEQFLQYIQAKGLAAIPKKGIRSKSTGVISDNNNGYFWTSDVSSKKNTNIGVKIIGNSSYELIETSSANGLNVKCIKTD